MLAVKSIAARPSVSPAVLVVRPAMALVLVSTGPSTKACAKMPTSSTEPAGARRTVW